MKDNNIGVYLREVARRMKKDRIGTNKSRNIRRDAAAEQAKDPLKKGARK